MTQKGSQNDVKLVVKLRSRKNRALRSQRQ